MKDCKDKDSDNEQIFEEESKSPVRLLNESCPQTGELKLAEAHNSPSKIGSKQNLFIPKIIKPV